MRLSRIIAIGCLVLLVQVSSSTNPTVVGSFQTTDVSYSYKAVVKKTAEGALDGSFGAYYAYALGTEFGKFNVVNINSLASPSVLATTSGTTFVYDGTNTAPQIAWPSDVAIPVGSTVAYVVSMNLQNGPPSNLGVLSAIDISTPSTPTVIGSIAGYAVQNNPLGNAMNGGNVLWKGMSNIEIDGTYAYITAHEANSLSIVDISNPAAMSIVGSIAHGYDDGQANKGRLERAFGLSKAGNYVYVACGWASRVTVVDVSDVTSPFFAGDYIDTTSGEMGYPIDVVVVGTVAYVSTWGTIVTLDVSDPTAPTRLGAVSSQTDLKGSWGIASDGIYVYVAANSNNKVAVVDVSNPASPYVAATVQDNTALEGTTGISVAGQYAFSSARAGGGFAIIDLGSYAAQVTTSGAPPGSGANGDPHIAFANGGRADFRGSHRGIYAFLSSPGYQFAPYFQMVDFWWTYPTGLKQLVHGTYMTKATWLIKTESGRSLSVVVDAMKGEAVRIDVGPSAAELAGAVAQGLAPPAASSVRMANWERKAIDEVRLQTFMYTLMVETPTWAVNVTSKPIYGLVQPWANETHTHGYWQENQKRLDISISGTFPQTDAHGVIGQSYQAGLVRNGKQDTYPIDSNATDASSDGFLPPYTTSAQAEGAIDGMYTDYKLSSHISTEFKYSRFNQVAKPPLKGGRVTKRASSTTERDVASLAALRKAEL